MTSKKALSNLRWNVSMSQDCNYKENNELCNIIEKDLEVLEILKNQFNYSREGCWYIDFDEHCLDTNSKENKMIKEWLKNGK